jgi:hypothetical protein
MKTTLRIRITVRGRLSDRLAAAFEGMTAVRRNSATELVGDVVDQAQLYGLLTRIRDLGLTLETVTVSEPNPASPAAAGSRPDTAATERVPKPVIDHGGCG